jgi:hypothetical protein
MLMSCANGNLAPFGDAADAADISEENNFRHVFTSIMLLLLGFMNLSPRHILKQFYYSIDSVWNLSSFSL